MDAIVTNEIRVKIVNKATHKWYKTSMTINNGVCLFLRDKGRPNARFTPLELTEHVIAYQDDLTGAWVNIDNDSDFRSA